MPEQGKIRDFLEWAKLAPSQQGYIAPTVYMKKGAKKNYVDLFKTKEAVFNSFRYNENTSPFTLPGHAQRIDVDATLQATTIGIGVDYYLNLGKKGYVQVPYIFLKPLTYENFKLLILKVYKTDGTGPFFCRTFPDSMAFSATPVGKVWPEKLAALDELHRNLQLVLAQYNTLTNVINDLSTKKLTPSLKVIYNEALVKQAKFKKDLLGIKGAEFSFGNKASVQIGTPILIPVIVGAVILSAITAYGVYKIIEIINITKQVLSNNDLQKFMADYKLRVAQSGIPQAEKDRLTKSAEATEKAAQDNNKKLTDDTTGKDGVLDKITNLVLISGGLFLVSKFIK